MSRVLLGHSYFLRFDPKLFRAMQPYPPLGTLYAAALLRERGHDVRVFDAMLATSTDEWSAMLHQQRPQFAVLFEDNFNYLSKMCLLNMREAAQRMIGAARAQGCTVVACGADVTDHASLYLDYGADYAVIGEGEETVSELLERLAIVGAPLRASSLSQVQGLIFRDEDGALVDTGRRPNLRDLDALPEPARDLVDLSRYREAWRRHGRFSMNLVTSRGCPFHCNWCAKPIWGQRFNVRSPADVVAEIASLRALGAGHLWFMDDIFGLKPDWLPAFADLIEAQGLRTPFKCLSRADLLLRPGEVDALRRAGCEMVWLGAESGSQAILDAMEKGTTVEQIHEAARRLKEAGIGVAFFLQFGYPGETWDDIQSTLQLVRECAPDDIGMSVSYPLPGTPFYDRVRDYMAGRQNWTDSDDLAMLYDGPYPTAFYHRLHATLHTEFRLRKASRDTSIPASILKLAATGQPKRALSLLRDAVMLPVQRARLDRMRRATPFNDTILPVKLNRHEAATPSRQEDTAGEAESSGSVLHDGGPVGAHGRAPLRRGAVSLEFEAAGRGFSAKAAEYDALAVVDPVNVWMRDRIRALVEAQLAPGKSILELNAGSGVDAAYFASQGYRVHATDIAPGMLAAIEAKSGRPELCGRLSVEMRSFTDLGSVSGAPYDLVFSNLGGLNCVEDLTLVARDLPTVLRPGGAVVWVIMPPISPWELLQAFRGHWRTATRRLRRGGTLAHVEDALVPTWYHTPGHVQQALGPRFRILSLRSFGYFSPPSFFRGFVRRHPRATQALMRLDDRLGRTWPLNRCGDFYAIVARYEP